jgi:hypothetical protein
MPTLAAALAPALPQAARRLPLGVVFPADANVPPLYMFFSRSAEGVKVLEAACSAAGVKLDRGRMVGSPERLNLFTIEGDNLRVDLELEAHVPSTLQPHAWVILEKGNRVPPERLQTIREAWQQSRRSGGGARGFAVMLERLRVGLRGTA